jgi:UDP-N-acetylmuramate--alanine ligase
MTMKLHFVGIGGSGISGVARLAEKLGFEVTGCDLEANSAYEKNILQGHSASHVKDADLIIVSPALLYQNNNNSELIEARKQNKLITWQEFVGKTLSKNKKVICIAGTHGKSTTTAMAGKLLEDADFDPLVVIGANVQEWNGNYRFGKGEYFVIEADEFNNNFLNYSPEIIILNNIEFDHPDFFKSEEDVFDSFKKFVGKLSGQKILIYNADSVGVQKLLSMIDSSVLRLVPYSFKHAKIDFRLKVPGVHNISNALGVVELGRVLGIKNELIKSSLENFSGISRRMELIADKNGIKVYDDYAHHPTAIAVTLEALRELYPDSRIWAIDEPHGFARTTKLVNFYKNVFTDADKVLIGPIFKARDTENFGMTPQIVAEKTEHSDAHGFDTFEEIKDIISKEIKTGDVILVMGAGKSYLWAREIVKLIK